MTPQIHAHTHTLPCPSAHERIWPLGDLLGILPHHVVLAEEEQGAVDCQAVLPDRYGVVQGHGPGSLGHRLLVHPLCSRSPPLPAATTAGPPLSTGTPAATSSSTSIPVG